MTRSCRCVQVLFTSYSDIVHFQVRPPFGVMKLLGIISVLDRENQGWAAFSKEGHARRSEKREPQIKKKSENIQISETIGAACREVSVSDSMDEVDNRLSLKWRFESWEQS